MATQITGFFHGGIAVSDMEASLRFYRDTLGLEVHFDVTLDAVAYVKAVMGIDMTRLRASSTCASPARTACTWSCWSTTARTRGPRPSRAPGTRAPATCAST